MITGVKKLLELYPGLDDNQYQPAGIDLKLGKINVFDNTDDVYAIVDNRKQLPKQVELPESAVKVGTTKLEVGYTLEPHKPYIAVVDKKIKIDKDYAQIYLPRSSLLRAGVDVRTALGDPGFHGHLSFLVINHNEVPFFIKKGERFAQMINIKVDEATSEYDGDYNE